MYLEDRIMLWNKSNREKTIPHEFTYMWNLKTKQTSKKTIPRLIDTEKTLVVTIGWGKGGMTGDEAGGSWSTSLQI